ncbi:hypothetical protein SAMN05444164_3829 [Bradyrhizobium erythrophlei]|uniref:Uncharacterized protein n=1 Tax=Bradyrhizobium erythrophlei TaxID=1437360 RepID=A0A1H4YA67_9BRAD|nr:hypothetical protein SAMN05444164_3829 [Bradyrhizobium erythrophlei]
MRVPHGEVRGPAIEINNREGSHRTQRKKYRSVPISVRRCATVRGAGAWRPALEEGSAPARFFNGGWFRFRRAIAECRLPSPMDGGWTNSGPLGFVGLPLAREAAVVDAVNHYPRRSRSAKCAKPAQHHASRFSAKTIGARTASKWMLRDGQRDAHIRSRAALYLHGLWQARLDHSFGRRAAQDGHWRLTGWQLFSPKSCCGASAIFRHRSAGHRS